MKTKEGADAKLTSMREGGYLDKAVAELGNALSRYIGTYYTFEALSQTGSGIDVNAAQAFIDELNTDSNWVDAEFTYGNTAQKNKTKPNCDIMDAWINR